MNQAHKTALSKRDRIRLALEMCDRHEKFIQMQWKSHKIDSSKLEQEQEKIEQKRQKIKNKWTHLVKQAKQNGKNNNN